MVTIFLMLLICVSKVSSINHNQNGFITYCPCMGRFGNQADHFLGVLAFSKAINRTLILPPWIEYRYGELRSIQIPFDTYFKVDKLLEYNTVITMEDFMREIAPTVWPREKRVSFCYMQRTGEEPNSCNAKSGNPFGPFWDTYKIDFIRSEFYGPLNYDAQNERNIKQWGINYPAEKWPVLAFTGAPASFPVQKENVYLHKYLKWSHEIEHKSGIYIKKYMSGGGFVGIHLRNGQDWVKACQHVKDSAMLFAAPQCVGYRNERGPLTMSMCYPKSSEIVKQLKRVIKKLHNIKYIFVASDSNHMIDELNDSLQRPEIKILKLQPSNPHMDLAILGQANYFIGNCVSSYSAFVRRERDTKGLPSEYWAFPQRKNNKHEEL